MGTIYVEPCIVLDSLDNETSKLNKKRREIQQNLAHLYRHLFEVIQAGKISDLFRLYVGKVHVVLQESPLSI